MTNEKTDSAQPPGAEARHLERISAHAARLFNDGIANAGDGRFAAARDCFAALVRWYPHDLEARSAFAFSCLEAGDGQEARRQWEQVLARMPRDERALRGIALAAERERSAATGAGGQQADPVRVAEP